MTFVSRRYALGGLGTMVVSSLPKAVFTQSIDPLTAQGTTSDQIVGPLTALTIHTSNGDDYRRFLQGGMGMATAALETYQLGLRYGLAQDRLQIRTYVGPNASPDAIKVRVIEGASPGVPELRPDHDALIPGLLSIGFPVSEIQARAKILAAYGFPANAGVTDITLPRADGSSYTVYETHHRAPDGVLCLCIDRATLKPVGPLDSIGLGIGGPAYSGMIVSNAGDVERLLVGVFGWQKRRDVVLSSSGPNGGLGLPAGQRLKFQQYFAPGTDTGYLVVMEHLMNQKPMPGKLGLSQRGLGMLSFKTKRLADVLARARAQNVTILAMPGQSTEIGSTQRRASSRSLILATPDGVPLEITQI